MLSDKTNAVLSLINQSNLTDEQKEQAAAELITKGLVPQFPLNYRKPMSERLKEYIANSKDSSSE